MASKHVPTPVLVGLGACFIALAVMLKQQLEAPAPPQPPRS